MMKEWLMKRKIRKIEKAVDKMEERDMSKEDKLRLLDEITMGEI